MSLLSQWCCTDSQATNDSPCELCGIQPKDSPLAHAAPDEFSRSPGEVTFRKRECSQKPPTFLAEALSGLCNPMIRNDLEKVFRQSDSFDGESHLWISEKLDPKHHRVWMG